MKEEFLEKIHYEFISDLNNLVMLHRQSCDYFEEHDNSPI